ncbi:MAG TPA: BrnA antitoxin family protein [Rhodopila sp.]|nr:BrnA antitoxin family protein [Rhodopila sp.]
MSFFSSESGADAETLDDDELLAACLGIDEQGPDRQPAEIPDWPPARSNPVTVAIDGDTAAWFKANSANWQREIGFVLRAWVAAHNNGSGSAA